MAITGSTRVRRHHHIEHHVLDWFVRLSLKKKGKIGCLTYYHKFSLTAVQTIGVWFEVCKIALLLLKQSEYLNHKNISFSILFVIFNSYFRI